MKVANGSSTFRALLSAAMIVAVAAVVSFSAPAPAEAITRDKILTRAKTWVHKRVRYSQNGYYRGYRRDCSGFVSMSWGLGKSYTTRTIHKRAKRIKISSLRPGDVVWRRGHVSVFGGWKNKKKRTYVAIEQTTWGSHAKRHVRKVPRGAKALRRKGLSRPKSTRYLRVASVKPSSSKPVVSAAASTTSNAAAQ